MRIHKPGLTWLGATGMPVGTEPLYDPATGPWADEPDHIVFRCGDFPCHISRSLVLGHLNGYVGVPAGHPYYGMGADDPRVDALVVHGGITWAAGRLPWAEENMAENRWYWFGFDAAHWGDWVPSWPEQRGCVYRDVESMQAECETLAAQLARAVTDRCERS